MSVYARVVCVACVCVVCVVRVCVARVCGAVRACVCARACVYVFRARVCATTPKHPPLPAHRSTLKGVEGRRRGRAVFLPRVGVGGHQQQKVCACPQPLTPLPLHTTHISPPITYTACTQPALARPLDPPQTPPARRILTAPLPAKEVRPPAKPAPRHKPRPLASLANPRHLLAIACLVTLERARPLHSGTQSRWGRGDVRTSGRFRLRPRGRARHVHVAGALAFRVP